MIEKQSEEPIESVELRRLSSGVLWTEATFSLDRWILTSKIPVVMQLGQVKVLLDMAKHIIIMHQDNSSHSL